MSKGGKAPKPPDYLALANQQAQSARDLAEYQVQANRPNQTGPYGSVKWTNNNGNWTQKTTLTPQQQKILNRQQAITGNAYSAAAPRLNNPTLNLNALPAAAINPGQTAQDAIMSRLSPEIDRERDSLENKLVNQGFNPTSEGYGEAFKQQGQRENDLLTQAALYGINAQQQARAQGLNEQQQSIYTPINAINSLRTGAQAQTPQYSPFSNQALTQPADYLGAAQQQYGANLNQYNANQANKNGWIGDIAQFAPLFIP